jgi:threonine/homoserine/homoserine lactone efflux protein
LIIQAIGAMLPAALAIALSPFPVIAIVLILASPHGRRNGPLFAVSWVAGLAVVATLIVVVFSGADDPDSTSATIADWLRVVAGAGLIVVGVRKWSARPRAGEEIVAPSWMASLDEASAGRALLLGALLSGANPKNFVLTAAAATSMVEVGAQGADLVVAVIAFVLVGSSAVIGAVVAHVAGGPRAASFLDAVREFMVAHSTVITVLVLLIIGATVLGDGLSGLDR